MAIILETKEQQEKVLKEIIGEKSVTEKGRQLLKQVISNDPSTKKVYVNFMEPLDVLTLIDALKYNFTITSLDLNADDIGYEAVEILAPVLQYTNITSLDLNMNYIRAAGICALAPVLPDTSITSIDLSSNNIGDAGICALASVLPDTSITSIDLSSNNIGDAGIEALASVLPDTSITSIDMAYNKISLILLDKINEVVRNNKAELAELTKYHHALEFLECKQSQEDDYKEEEPILTTAETEFSEHHQQYMALEDNLLQLVDILFVDVNIEPEKITDNITQIIKELPDYSIRVVKGILNHQFQHFDVDSLLDAYKVVITGQVERLSEQDINSMQQDENFLNFLNKIELFKKSCQQLSDNLSNLSENTRIAEFCKESVNGLLDKVTDAVSAYTPEDPSYNGQEEEGVVFVGESLDCFEGKGLDDGYEGV